MQMNAIRPAALPGELAPGYAGRFVTLNGFSSWVQACKQLFSHDATRYWDDHSSEDEDVLAQIAGLSAAELVSRHTLKPLLRGFVKPSRKLLGTSHHPRYSRRKFSYFCEVCAEEDVAFHGTSYWRREHQLVGMHWCLKHGIPLRYDTWRAPIVRSPSACLPVSQVVDRAWLDVRAMFPAVTQTLELASELLDVAGRADLKQVNMRLKQLLIERQMFHGGSHTGLLLLSDLLLEQFDPVWLEEVIPAFANKEPGVFIRAIDLLGSASFPGSSTVYVPALIALTGSVDAALNLVSASAPRRHAAMPVA